MALLHGNMQKETDTENTQSLAIPVKSVAVNSILQSQPSNHFKGFSQRLRLLYVSQDLLAYRNFYLCMCKNVKKDFEA